MAFAVASSVLYEVLHGPDRPARVIATSPAAAYLELATGPAPRLVALLARDAVRVPIGMVLPVCRDRTGFETLALDSPARIGGGGLRLAGGPQYRPVRYWRAGVPPLRAALGTPAARRRLEVLAGLPVEPTTAPVLDRLAAALAGATELDAAVGALLGLGPGLTPAGDDVLAGALVALIAADEPVARSLATAVRGRIAATTPVSAALLEQACAGRAVPELIALLRALAGAGDLDRALAGLAGVGHTSGHALGVGVRLALRACPNRSLRRAA